MTKWRLYDGYFHGPGRYSLEGWEFDVDDQGLFEPIEKPPVPLYAIAAIAGSKRDFGHSTQPSTTRNVAKLILWAVIVIVMALFLNLQWSRGASADLCHVKPASEIGKKGGYKWQWRTIDGRKCWYYSNQLVAKENLVWSYTEEEFNSDIERVIERKFEERFYFPENRNGDLPR